jgi:hypothetical protein
MLALRELQVGFRAALLADEAEAVAGVVRADGLGASARLAVYRHHVFTSLTAALEATYPVVVRLVDRRFFAYLAHHYIRASPPAGPCLHEYGGTLPAFLARFEPCRHLGYLPDVARLEWAMNLALHAADVPSIEPRALLDPGPVTLHPSVTLLSSPWPVGAIWRANQPDAGADPVDLTSGGVRLQVWRADDVVVFRVLSPAAFAFRAALARTGRLEGAVAAALDADPAADPALLLREVLDEQALV